jgi:hypothetical protein
VQKVKKRMMFWTLAACVLLSGCLKGNGNNETRKDGLESTKYDEIVFLTDEGDAWKDNALDDLHAVINLPVQINEPEGAIEGGRAKYIVGEEGCILFKNHLFKTNKKFFFCLVDRIIFSTFA